MEKIINELYQILQKLTGSHRQLLDLVRLERQTLVEANLKGIQNLTQSKQALIENIHQLESSRLKLAGELSLLWKKPYREITLTNIIIEIQAKDPKTAEQFRTTLNVLTILIQRISAQNLDNRAFVEKSLEHINHMKKNILDETVPKSNTYTQRGKKMSGSHGSRLISKEV